MNETLLSFDIEDWFHILAHEPLKLPHSWLGLESRIDYGVNQILSLLDRYEARATFFVLGWIAKKYPYIIEQIKSAGHHIGSHSMNHQLVFEQQPAEFISDLTESKKIIEDIIQSKVDYYRAPGFSITEETLWAFDALLECGFTTDCSLFPYTRSHGGIRISCPNEPFLIDTPNGTLRELPMSTNAFGKINFIAFGGGYFRLTPKFLITHLNNTARYKMVYLHPREFDVKQPKIKGLSHYRSFKHYIGLKTVSKKLEIILAQDTSDLESFSESYKWHNAWHLVLAS